MAASRPFAVITGASSGIGRELGRQFVTNNFDVLITAEDGELAAAADDLTGPGTNVQAVRADLATPDGAEELAAAITATGRAVDALALNAGVGNGGAFVDVPLADEQRLIAVMAGKDQVVGGSGRNKVQAAGAKLMPDQARAAVHARMTRPEEKRA